MISDPTYVLLPGMIGTADLFRELLKAAPDQVRARVIGYPTRVFLPYPEILQLIETELSNEQQIVLIGESYSGSLALMYAAANPQKVVAVILSAAYVSPPWPSWMRILIRPVFLRIHIPTFLIRYVAAGRSASKTFVNEVRSALARPTPQVMVQRAKEALTMDNQQALIRCQSPILYLSPSQDHMVRAHNRDRIIKLRPDVWVAKIEGPHLLLQVAPAQAWKAIEKFLSTQSTAVKAHIPHPPV